MLVLTTGKFQALQLKVINWKLGVCGRTLLQIWSQLCDKLLHGYILFRDIMWVPDCTQVTDTQKI